ncbi:MAG: hypothetical protein ACRD08_06050 [Acidimicrobiales bacterium]
MRAYLARRVGPERVVAAVAAAYYRETGSGKRETWRPLMDVIERAAPGVVELAATTDTPGFAVNLGERPFPAEYEDELRRVATAILGEGGRGKAEGYSLLQRLVASLRRLFSASTTPPTPPAP